MYYGTAMYRGTLHRCRSYFLWVRTISYLPFHTALRTHVQGLTVGTSFTSTRDLLRIPNISAVGGHAPPVVSAPTPPANTNLLTSPAASRLLHSRTLMSFPQQRLPATLAQSRTPPEQQRAALHTRRDLPTPHQHPPAMHDQTLPAIRQPAPSASTDVEMAPPPSQGAKRRLGMGRGNVGYSNKKFKLPT